MKQDDTETILTSFLQWADDEGKMPIRTEFEGRQLIPAFLEYLAQEE